MNWHPDFYQDGECDFSKNLRQALRGTVVNVVLLTTRDRSGAFHGLAVTTAVPFSTHRPAIIVAVNNQASAFPAIRDSGYFCLNQITTNDIDLLDRFSRSDKRASRFTSERWVEGMHGLPYLARATTCFFCDVQQAYAHDDQTVFIGKIDGVRLGHRCPETPEDPLIWLNGGAAKLARREIA